MSSTKSTKLEQRRRDHNADLVRRMKDGEALTSFDSTSSWFPPRPIVQKDQRAIDRLYGDHEGKNSADESERKGDSEVIPLRKAN